MLDFLKNYYVFMLVLLVISYLVPKEDYKVYIQFFIGIFVIVLLLKPVLEFITLDNQTYIYDMFENLNAQINQLDVEMEEREDMFEYFFIKGERE